MPADRETLLARVMQLGHPEKKARALILAGRVRVGGIVMTHAGRAVPGGDSVEVEEPSGYPGRGATKLIGALDAFGVSVEGRVALDLGAAHGGFCAVLLERGARRVYAVDVAYGMLAYGLRTDPRVVVLERRNARDLHPDWFAPVDLAEPLGWIVTADLSFISLRGLLRVIAAFGRTLPGGWEGVLLVKPQFENSAATHRGVLRDEAAREDVLAGVLADAERAGLGVVGQSDAVIRGRQGNQEVFLHLRPHAPDAV